MQRLEVSGAVRPINGSLGVKRLIVPQVVKKFPSFCVNQSCIFVFTRARHLSLCRGLSRMNHVLPIFLEDPFLGIFEGKLRNSAVTLITSVCPVARKERFTVDRVS